VALKYCSPPEFDLTNDLNLNLKDVIQAAVVVIVAGSDTKLSVIA
jgi:hypothetical protein